jgi:putative nucleotidyltransferase with HDIG domain
MAFRFTALGGRTFLLVTLVTGVTLGSTLLVLNTASNGALKTGAGLSGLIVIAGLATIATRSITRPLNQLIAALREGVCATGAPVEFPENSRVWELKCLAEALTGAARSVRHSQSTLDHAYLQFVETMAQVLDARDPYTAGHSIRVSAYSHAIARAMDLPASEAESIRIAAQLHDIGKIAAPDAVLQKPGRLTAAEFGLIKLHPQIGRKILQKVGRFQEFLGVVELHHENYDGTGYPYKLSGEHIPIGARIVHVADAFDAMTTNRSYREALPASAAVEELRKHSGTHFDPEVVRIFLRLIGDNSQADMLFEPHLGLLAGQSEDRSVPVLV